MVRWYVGVKPDGQREVFSESTGTDPVARLRGYEDVCGPYKSKQLAGAAARGKQSVDGGSLRRARRTT